MSWIHVVTESEADGRLAEAYERIARQRGKVSNIMRVHSLAPDAMVAHMDLYRTLMFEKGGLSRAECELIAVVVSVENRCEYCTLHHAAALRAWWKSQDRVDRLIAGDLEGADLSERELAVVDYAQALTRSPREVGPEQVERLREAGLGDDEILRTNLIASYFNFANRITEGLGVTAPPDEVEGYRY